jgi:hypothetical protein
LIGRSHLGRKRRALVVDGPARFGLLGFERVERGLGCDPARPDACQLLACILDIELGGFELGGEGIALFSLALDFLANRVDPATNLFQLRFFGGGLRCPPRMGGAQVDEEADHSRPEAPRCYTLRPFSWARWTVGDFARH